MWTRSLQQQRAVFDLAERDFVGPSGSGPLEGPWARFARDHEIRLRDIEKRRWHRFSSTFALCEAASGQLFGRPPSRLHRPISTTIFVLRSRFSDLFDHLMRTPFRTDQQCGRNRPHRARVKREVGETGAFRCDGAGFRAPGRSAQIRAQGSNPVGFWATAPSDSETVFSVVLS